SCAPPSARPGTRSTCPTDLPDPPPTGHPAWTVSDRGPVRRRVDSSTCTCAGSASPRPTCRSPSGGLGCAVRRRPAAGGLGVAIGVAVPPSGLGAVARRGHGEPAGAIYFLTVHIAVAERA